MDRWKDTPGELEFSLKVNYTSTGYWDPGQTYGPVENCYPPEGECETTLETIEIDGKPVPPELAKLIFDHLSKQVDEHAREHTPDVDDYDDYEPRDRD